MEIRTASLDDAAELCDYAARLFGENLPGIFKRPAPTLEEECDFIRSHLNPPNSTLLVAVSGDEIIGLIGLTGGALEEERHVGTFGLSVISGWASLRRA